ncbi:bone morphogenetic protein 15 [Pelodytes ibericus]
MAASAVERTSFFRARRDITALRKNGKKGFECAKCGALVHCSLLEGPLLYRISCITITRMPGPPHLKLLALIFIGVLAPADGRNGLRVLARSSSLPLIRTLLEDGPQEPVMAIKRDLNMHHLRFMLDLYKKSADGDGRPKSGRQIGAEVRLVRPASQASFVTDAHWHMKDLIFSLQDVINTERLERAIVMHPRAIHIEGACFFCKVDLASVTGLKTRISPGNRKWVETDLTSLLKNLMEGPKKSLNLELQITCRKLKMHPTNPIAVSTSYVPFLLLYLNHTLHGVTREKRMVKKEPRKGEPGLLIRKPRQAGTIGTKLPRFSNQSGLPKNRCVLRPFWVSFHQLGWDHWIIAPHRYNPGYCKGDCPRMLHSGYNSPNHAIIQNFINQVVDESVPRPSCVPYSYGPISVLMIEPEGKILYKEYENMMAESCTCR